MLRLETRFVSGLLAQPESGMGFQRVEVEAFSGGIALGIVLNAELLVLDEERPRSSSAGMFANRSDSAESSAGRIRAVRVLRGSASQSAVWERTAHDGGAKNAPIEQTTAGQEDARNVKTGRDAVSRYALPNPESASWVSTVRPAPRTAIKRGTVAPANDQRGGGVEVIFPKGTQPGTTTGPTKIPD